MKTTQSQRPSGSAICAPTSVPARPAGQGALPLAQQGATCGAAIVDDGHGPQPLFPGAPVLLSVQDLADLLRVGLTTAYRLVEEGQIPAIRIGARRGRGVIRVRLDEVMRWLSDGGTASAPSVR